MDSEDIEESKEQARVEAARITKAHVEQLAQEVNRAKAALKKEVSTLALAAAEKILMAEVDEGKNRALLDSMIEEL